AHGTDRAEALRRLERALAGATLLGVRSNVDFLRRVVAHPAHRAGQISTAFIEQHAADLLATPEPRPGDVGSVETAALVAALARTSAWAEGQRWRNNPNRPLVERFTASAARGGMSSIGERTIEVRLTPRGREAYSAVIVHAAGEEAMEVVVRERRAAALAVELDGRRVRAEVVESGGAWWVKLGGATHTLVWRSPLPEPQARSGGQRSLAAPMPGQVIAVLVEEGQAVRSGDPLLVLAAMKMEHTLRAPRDGVVAALRFPRGAQVPAGAVLLELRPLEEVAP
ncbi:MAG TPA: biotin/lipoyl-containing protein, partial [Ktedonobacterales bacterium]|nr:biotin/lipoyl-containing protein [Ktedonobacterales bacterium]